jgi:hypothetical protein
MEKYGMTETSVYSSVVDHLELVATELCPVSANFYQRLQAPSRICSRTS